MTRALVALNDATYGGVYYSDDIDFTNPAVQPTWTKYATTGLANTLILIMQNDPYTPYDNVYVQLENRDIYRWNGTSWTLILDVATARTLAGSGYGSATLYYITVDRSTAGAIYTITDKVFGAKILKSLDYGATWSVVTVGGSNFISGGSYLQVYGQYMRVCTGSVYRSIHYSNDGGVSWGDNNIWPSSGGGAPIRINPHNPTEIYYHNTATDFDLISVVGAPVKTILQAGYNLGSEFHDRHWIDPVVAGHQRILRNISAGDKQLFTTVDSWANLVDTTPDVLQTGTAAFGSLAAARENSAYIMYGYSTSVNSSTTHKVFAVNGEGSATTWGINGANVGTPPYTDSIPSVANNYIAVQGIWVGEAPVSSGIFTYASEYGDDITTLTDEPVTPMPGDRGSWFDYDADEDADGNPFSWYHAQDIADETPQRHAPWSIPAPAAGYGIVSDNTKWVISSAALALITDLHNAVTLGADAEILLSLNGQQIIFDPQTANYVLAGPTSGAAADPTFRALRLSNGDIADVNMTGAVDGAALVYNLGSTTWVDSILIRDNATTVQIGDATNYTSFDHNGTMTMVEGARVLKEVRVNIAAAAKGAAAPVDALRAVGSSGNIKVPVSQFSKTTQNDVYFEIHLPEDLDSTEDVFFHLMWFPGASWTAGNYMWKLEYLITDEHGVELNAEAPTTISADVTPTAATNVIETEYATAITGAEPDFLVWCHFYRDVANDNADDIGSVRWFEIEYTSNKLGEKYVVPALPAMNILEIQVFGGPDNVTGPIADNGSEQIINQVFN